MYGDQFGEFVCGYSGLTGKSGSKWFSGFIVDNFALS